MASDDMQDRESLSSSTVAQLREICKNRGLIVSGKKADLIDRILEDSGVSVIRGEGEKKNSSFCLRKEEREEEKVKLLYSANV